MLPANFDPTDPALWKMRCYAYDQNLEPKDNLRELGFTRQELTAIVWLRGMRATVVSTGLSLFITIDGRHRSGKSRFAVTMAALFSKEFEKDMAKFIVTDADSLLNLVEEIESKKIFNPIIIVDEAGSALNSADWYERIQKAIIKTLTIVGFLHPTIIFIAPIKDLVLSGIRKMSHVYMKMTRSTNAYTVIIPYEVVYNSLKGKTYFKKFKITLFGMPIKINAVRVTLPPKWIDEEYGAIEAARKPIMLKDIRADAMKAEIKQKRDVVDFDEISVFVAKNYKYFESERSKPGHLILDHLLIRAKFRIPIRDAQTIQRLAMRKMNGVDVNEIQESDDVKPE
jgi:hypothetical protein